MGGFFGVASKQDCVFDLFFGTDYHSHLGTKRGRHGRLCGKTALTGRFITLKIHLSGRSLTRCGEHEGLSGHWLHF